jgi:hypothetical protein
MTLLAHCNRFLISWIVSLIFSFLLITGIAYAQTDLDEDGTPDSEDIEVIILSNISLPAGEYSFQNLIITNNAIVTLNSNSFLEGFKGVRLNAENLTLEQGTILTAGGKGYAGGDPDGDGGGPGRGRAPNNGAGHGGSGGRPAGGGAYGSHTQPFELGSGGGGSSIDNGGYGGGAIAIFVNDTLRNEGKISSNGDYGSIAGTYYFGGGGSGGSIYIIADRIVGNGLISTDGGISSFSGGSGGRIAIYYNWNDFSGIVSVTGGTGNQNGAEGTSFIKKSTTTEMFHMINCGIRSIKPIFSASSKK